MGKSGVEGSERGYLEGEALAVDGDAFAVGLHGDLLDVGGKLGQGLQSRRRGRGSGPMRHQACSGGGSSRRSSDSWVQGSRHGRRNRLSETGPAMRGCQQLTLEEKTVRKQAPFKELAPECSSSFGSFGSLGCTSNPSQQQPQQRLRHEGKVAGTAGRA